MIVLDASVVIALYDPRDSHHDRAEILIRDHAAGGFRMHELTLAEVLVGPVRTGQGSQRFGDLISLGVVTHKPVGGEPLNVAELRASTGLKLPDCCVLVVARSAGLPLATFDDRLAVAAESMGLVVLR